MYQDNLAYANTAEKEKPQLVYVNDDFRNELNRYRDLVGTIQDKLHNIMNLREPEKPMNKGDQTPMSSSFVEQMKENIGELSNCNIRLGKVLDHLNRIV